MTTAAIHLHGTPIGAISWDPDLNRGIFEYEPSFLNSGIEIAPLTMPLAKTRYTFPDLPRETYKGLPGLLADSLPDKFGNLLIDRWLASQGRSASSFDPVERLCYLGNRAIGALEFHPALPVDHPPERLQLDALVQLANDILASRNDLPSNPAPSPEALAPLISVGASAGGARAKALVAWNPATDDLRPDRSSLPDGFESWLLKFDGVSENRDKESSDPLGYGRIEYAYHLMAREAGISMSDCRLLEENDRAHFMTRRFDRGPGNAKFHFQSLCGIAHFDFNQAGAYSYEQAFLTARRLSLPQPDVSELFRRAVFNIMARNQDDHTKNIAFIMDRRGQWRLAPAYDLIYAFNPHGLWTSRHQMSLNGKRDDFRPEDLKQAATAADLKPPQAKAIIAEVHQAVSRWSGHAIRAGVLQHWQQEVQKHLRLTLRS